MSDDRTVKTVLLGKPDGRRNERRPELRWLDCIENDLKSMCVKRWRKKERYKEPDITVKIKLARRRGKGM
jgi:glutathione S-transferase